MKTVKVLTGLVVFLVLASSGVGGDEESPGNSASELRIEDETFAFVPGNVVLVEDHYALALYENAEKSRYVLALFTANCDGDDCRFGELVAYSIFDAQPDAVHPTNNLPAESQKDF